MSRRLPSWYYFLPLCSGVQLASCLQVTPTRCMFGSSTFFSFERCGGTIIFGSLGQRKTPISSAQEDTDFALAGRRVWERRNVADGWWGSRWGIGCWPLELQLSEQLVRHENDSSPTIFEICGSLSRRAFSVLSGVSVICVLES